MKRMLITLLIALILPVTAMGSMLYSSDYKWKTIHTEHFRIHYHQGERDLAYRVAVIAEGLWPELENRLHYAPRPAVEIVLSDDTDASNGSSSMLPVNVVRLFAQTPHPSMRLDEYDDWLRLLLTHELTHTFHIDSVRGMPKVLRHVFGRVITPNRYNPIFSVEGLAVWHETNMTTRGRAQGAHSDMIARAEWERKFPPIDKISTWTTQWPAGARPYILGGLFHRWIAENVGPDVWGNVSYRHAGQLIPFFHNRNMKKVAGQKQTKLYKKWVQYLDVRYSDLYRALEQRGFTPTERLTFTGNGNARPQFSADGKSLFFEESTGSRSPRIRRMDLETRKFKNHLVFYPRSTSGDAVYFPDASIIYTQSNPYEVYKSYYDFYRYDADTGKTKRLTKGLRSRDIALAPDGQQLLYVQNKLERPTIGWFDLQTLKETAIYTPDKSADYIQFAEPVISPDGKMAAFTVWHNDGNRDIFLYEFEKAEFRRMTFDAQRDIAPAFTPDGRYIIFSSGRTGIYNLYALELETEKMYRITNLFGGAFDPAISPDMTKIAFIGYGPKGYDVYLMAYDPSSWEEISHKILPDRGFAPCIIGREIGSEANEAKEKYDETPYSPFPAILPRYWTPNYGSVEGNLALGLKTMAADSLYHHIINAAAVYSWDSEFLSYGLSYTNATFRPNYTIAMSRYAVNYGKSLVDNEGKWRTYYEDRVNGTIGASYPLTGYQSVYLQGLFEDRRRLSDYEDPLYIKVETGLFSGIRLGWMYSNATSYRKSVSAADGWSLGANYTAFTGALGSDYEVRTLMGNAHRYFGLPWNHAIALRGVGGFAEGEILKLRAFRIGGFGADQPLGEPIENQVTLRGYRLAAQRGQRVAAGSLEYRLPLIRPERGIWTWPIFLNDITLHAYGDGGTAWLEDLEPYFEDDRKILAGAGGELNIHSTISYYFSFNIKISAAYGFIEPDTLGGFRWMWNIEGLF